MGELRQNGCMTSRELLYIGIEYTITYTIETQGSFSRGEEKDMVFGPKLNKPMGSVVDPELFIPDPTFQKPQNPGLPLFVETFFGKRKNIKIFSLKE